MGPDPQIDLTLDGSGPLYEQIRRAIALRITNGAWPPGTRVPPEQLLMRQLGTSRMTVHRAMVALAEDGLVQRRRRTGTVVAVPPVSHAVMTIPDIQEAIAASGRTHRLEIILQQHFPEGSPVLRGRFGSICEGNILHLVCRHLADEKPYVIEDRVISLDVAPDAIAQTFTQRPPGSWLLDTVPWTQAEHAISAIALDEPTAHLLGLKASQPALQVLRRTWNGEQHVTVVFLIYPGESHVFVGRFAPYAQNSRRDATG
jgi:GntR family transcriptional regulator, histidine utilization repressor